jgi:cullin-associated NEDD8-dissociated protein 1
MVTTYAYSPILSPLTSHSVGPLAKRTPSETLGAFIDKVIELTATDIDATIPNTALRSLIASLPHPTASGIGSQEVKDAYTAVSRVLIPRLVGRVVVPGNKPAPKVPFGLLEPTKDKGYNPDALEVMTDAVKSYGPLMHESELVALAQSVMKIIENPQAGGVVKKRALTGIGTLLVNFSDSQVSSFINALIQGFQTQGIANDHRRYLIATVGSLAKATPSKFGPHLDVTVPYVLAALSREELEQGPEDSDDEVEADAELEELRETALQSVEAMVTSCPSEMQSHNDAAVDAALRCLKYDPNVAGGDDEEMEGTQEEGSDDGVTEEAMDEDDEYAELDDEGAFSDVDDLSWKVRRCAAKAILALINGMSTDDHENLFGRIAPVLLSRLHNEREENVRLEIVAATTVLIRKAGPPAKPSYGSSAFDTDSPPSNTRKRRRQDSEVSQGDPELRGLVLSRSSPPVAIVSAPDGGPEADLAALVPKIVQALAKVWKQAGIPLKQAGVVMVKALATSRNGALADHLQQLEDPIADALKPGTGPSGANASTSSATVAGLQIETLSTISIITESNSASALTPFVIALIPSVTMAVKDRNFKVSSEALATMEQFVKALTPPRLQSPNQDHAIHIETLFNVIMDRVTDNNTDLEVRHRAIQVFGVLIARTSSTELLSADARGKALGVLDDRLKNETTRLASARAIGLIGESAGLHDSIGSQWVQDVSLEMANQLRKSDRALRAACLEALQYLALNSTTTSLYSTTTIEQLKTQLLPLLSGTDLNLLTPALVILARIIPTNASSLVTEDLIQGLATISKSRLEGAPLKAYLLVIKVIGEHGAGSALMKNLLSVGVAGDTLVMGRAIGTLLVFSSAELTVTVPTFLGELQTAQDPSAICLALSVLGEVGFRLGSKSPVQMETFTGCLSAESDRVRLTAAAALGSASSSNLSACLPMILQNLGTGSEQEYLYLHALKEILQHVTDAGSKGFAAYASELWQKLLSMSMTEDNQAVGAECIGRLAMTDPDTYIPQLSQTLQGGDVRTRGTVISAFRFTLADSSSTYNSLLSRLMIPMLRMMLSDEDIGNRRLAVTTLNAAIHNKPELIVPDINQVLPQVLSDSVIKPELIKVITIGPFKHNEDSGMDLRKSAYGTLYALLDSSAAVSRLPVPKIFDRILDGILDDADIRTLCMLMLARLMNHDPDETRRRLPALAEKFKTVLGQKIKENAVKQEIEKVNEANAAVIRASLDLDKRFPSSSIDPTSELAPWRTYITESVRKEFAAMVRSLQAES